ncbi:MAG: zinc-binding dehydrogenase [Lewinellaceae bacterium]|nr:zinc-binding dehydrogenase [Saprospiraceae bacterium]MCB9340586.1 zinc-binding dehydrogenase [Lewinellaceae bacterium]
MKALVLQKENLFPTLQDFQQPVPKEDQVLVNLQAAALNHRDVWIANGKYPGIQFPVVLGSDGAGLAGGKPVVIQPGIDWGKDERFQSKPYQIIGMPQNGTFAEYISVDQSQVLPMPEHLDFLHAAALPLAGLTAYRVLFTRCNSTAGEKVLITGIGGGVAVTCLQFAVAAGMKVFVTSSSDEKIEKAITLGAIGGANYKRKTWPKEIQELAGSGMDVIIDSAGGDSFSHLVKLCSPGGRIGIYGGTDGPIPNLSPQLIFWRQISILGSTMGSNKDFAKMLDFVEQHKIVPVVDMVFKLENANNAFERMSEGQQFGKIVFDMA